MATWRMDPGRLRRPLAEGRVRRPPASGFGWVDRRLITTGHLAQLRPSESLLYFFLCTVADAQGLSFWGDRRICSALNLEEPELDRARTDLERRGLILYRYPIYQLLPLPDELAPPKDVMPPRTDPIESRSHMSQPKRISDILPRLGFPHRP